MFKFQSIENMVKLYLKRAKGNFVKIKSKHIGVSLVNIN